MMAPLQQQAPADGMLPEWAPQSGIMLTWPHPDTDWKADMPAVERCFARIAHEISVRQALITVCRDQLHVRHIRQLIASAGGDLARVRCYVAPSNDSWARDHGPITVMRAGRLTLLDFRFDGWGGKYPADLDDRITGTIHGQGAFGDTPVQPVDLVLEGGSVEVDGQGTLLTTSRCLLAAKRNPGLGKAEVESELMRWLAVTRILWLEHGRLEGDDTDGHIDALARFCRPDTIVYQSCDDQGDAHYESLGALARELRAQRRADGTAYRLAALPWPGAMFDHGRRLPATYANFLILNGAVLVPGYDDPADAGARAVLSRCFPDRAVVLVDCRPLIRQLGSLHCVTMQLPAGVVPVRAAET